MTTDTLSRETASLLAGFGIGPEILTAGDFAVTSPIDGSRIAALRRHTPGDLDPMIAAAERAFLLWRAVPPPRRGELVRLFAEELRRHKPALGRLVSIEAGKILEEGQGEVQEMIDICDFAVGLSRQLYGKVIASERPGHRMLESWCPLGPAGIITAFNFPVAVWSWNAALALVCGDPLIWKPSDKTPLCALACNAILGQAVARFGDVPEELRRGLSQVAIGGSELGEALCDDRRVPLVSATGSTRMGAIVGPRVAQRFGRTLLELGGNNGMIVAPSADLDLALRAILFAAVGTAGQRCTSLRRLIVHDDIAETLVTQLKRAYAQVKIGNPLEPGTLVGPLIGESAFTGMQRALDEATRDGGQVFGGERVLAERWLRMPITSGRRSSRCHGRRRSFGARPLRRSFMRCATAISTKRSRCTIRCRRASLRASSRPICARPSSSPPRWGAIAASSMSISGRAARRSAAPLAARRKPAAAAKPAAVRGRPICGA